MKLNAYLNDKQMQQYYKLRHYRVFYWSRLVSHITTSSSIQKYIADHKVRKLHLGCWPFVYAGWLNSDLYGNKGTISLDVTKRFPLPDKSFHYVFQEHLIEHFPQEMGLAMCKESYRVLKKGGKIRIATPDLEFLGRFYKKPLNSVQKKYMKWTAETFFPEAHSHATAFVINNFVRNWGHQFVYDFEALKYTLEQAGFSHIKRCVPSKSTDSHLSDLESHWKSIGKDFNELETLVVEGTKA